MPHHHHAIDYVELNAPDLAAARRFYGAAFGWEFNDYGPDYAGIRGPEPDAESGGLTPDGPANPLVILYSDDVDTSLRAVVDAGGTILTGPYDFPGGRRFHFSDPAGNELAVWGPAAR
ncbi:MAG: VOC family protein [Micropruina sp.]|uniref:VOC family protein n=1 Tax=Micropruina sp. TaxID=2737536 RepID=UPI0039E35A15